MCPLLPAVVGLVACRSRSGHSLPRLGLLRSSRLPVGVAPFLPAYSPVLCGFFCLLAFSPFNAPSRCRVLSWLGGVSTLTRPVSLSSESRPSCSSSLPCSGVVAPANRQLSLPLESIQKNSCGPRCSLGAAVLAPSLLPFPCAFPFLVPHPA